MTLPLRPDQALHRQQRWFEVKNVEQSDTLSAYSVVEIAGSIRPESAESETPGCGRTVIEVQKATSDSPQNTIVLGHMDIVAGGFGYGTNDFPAWGLYTGGPPAVGEEWGVANGAAVLSTGKMGYIVVGDAHDGVVRIMKIGAIGGQGRMTHIGLCDTATHAPDTYQTYNIYYLNSGTTIPSISNPLETVEAWNETGQNLSNSIMCLLAEVDTNTANKFIALPIELEDCTNP